MSDLNSLLADALRSGIGGPVPPSTVDGSGSTSSSQGVSGAVPTDTVSQANETKNKVVLALLGWDAGGAEVLNKDLLAIVYNEMSMRIVSHITDQMAKSSQQMRELLDEEVKQKIRLGLEKFFSQSSDLQTNKEAALADKSVYATLTLASVTSMMMMSATVLGQVAIPANAAIEDVQLHGLHPSALTGLDQSIQPLLIASGAFVSVGLTAPVMRTLALTSQKGQKALPEGAAAKAYGVQVARSVMAGHVEGLVKATMGDASDELISKVELSYLFGALVAVEKGEIGWINLEEMVSLLTGGAIYNKLNGADRSDPRVVISDLIQEKLALLSASDRLQLMLTHLDYYRDSAGTEELEEQAELIRNFWKDFDYEQLSENRA